MGPTKSGDRAHVLAGGGRELCYVALSRARDHTTIHTTADDLTQAVDDLQTDWGTERSQGWVTDTTARPGHEPEPARASRLPDRQDDPRRRLTALNEDHYALYAGTGRWSATAAGAAARELNDARDRLVEARHAAEDSTARSRDRRAAVKVLPNVEHSR